MKSRKIRNSILLTIAAFIWGVAFVAQREGGDLVGPYSFNCIRSLIGGIILLPVIFIFDKAGITNKKTQTKEEKKILLKSGFLCGCILFVATNLQQVGLFLGTQAGKAGFLTACYILLVPILGIFLGRKCGIKVWAGVVLAVVGLYLLCMNGSFTIQLSDGLILLCALVFSAHILTIDHFSPLVDGVRLSCIQFLVCGFLGLFPMFFFEMGHSVAGITAWSTSLMTLEAWIPILYAGVMSSGVGYTLQIVGQNGLNPTIASLIMSLESVFSALAGAVLLKEVMQTREIIGCVLVFAAIILAQLPNKKDLR